MVLLLFVFALVAGLLAACGGGSSSDKSPSTNQGAVSNPSSGPDAEKLYSANCSSCHGAKLEGGAGPKLSDIGSKLSKDQILSVIQNGQGFMGANIIKGDDADAVAAWLADKK